MICCAILFVFVIGFVCGVKVKKIADANEAEEQAKRQQEYEKLKKEIIEQIKNK